MGENCLYVQRKQFTMDFEMKHNTQDYIITAPKNKE